LLIFGVLECEAWFSVFINPEFANDV